MGKKWNTQTKILFEKKKEIGISRLSISYIKKHPKNPYQLIYDGHHVAFFQSWEDAFQVIDDVTKFGIEKIREDNKRVMKQVISRDDEWFCYRCEKFRNKDLFKWGHKYCLDCCLNQKKEYYYTNKYNLFTNRYSSFENYFKTLIHKRNRKLFFNVHDLMVILENQNFKCAITGQDFILEKGNPKLPSIDRINPKSKGGEYNLDNIQIIWHGLNSFKSMWDMEFIKECSKLIVSRMS